MRNYAEEISSILIKKNFSSPLAKEVIVGKKLAKKLNIKVNEDIFIFTINEKNDKIK